MRRINKPFNYGASHKIHCATLCKSNNMGFYIPSPLPSSSLIDYNYGMRMVRWCVTSLRRHLLIIRRVRIHSRLNGQRNHHPSRRQPPSARTVADLQPKPKKPLRVFIHLNHPRFKGLDLKSRAKVLTDLARCAGYAVVPKVVKRIIQQNPQRA